ncbi:hypothetical protein KOR42_16320 [Thalassoglobus neptunius]|uniref:PsbP C-terminal domain-containing protein n=1 Tax=Thalassoglobus neptunius TaxID=1938619 RepID=A0A5C5X5Q0_9PLAN|nr:hypothetical protein [Thalassoglobus neptunius]TWT58260.1 hypothetical protein KOR42_16320 [Thalassoglobus neptunius]
MSENAPFDDFDADDTDGFSTQSPSPGMSTGMKVLMGLLIFSAVSLVICCGGIYWFVSNSTTATENPAEIDAMRDEIATIVLPAVYEPGVGVGFNLFIKMDMVAYGRSKDPENGGIVLMQMSGPSMMEEEDLRLEFEKEAEKQGTNQDIDVTSQETRTFTIDGEEVDFEFVTGTRPESDDVVHQVVGVFKGREGMAFLMIFETDNNWNEEEVVRMIESISTK